LHIIKDKHGGRTGEVQSVPSLVKKFMIQNSMAGFANYIYSYIYIYTSLLEDLQSKSLRLLTQHLEAGALDGGFEASLSLEQNFV
jgi:hypothetical protein